jgi:hypothetical protein
MLRRVTLVRTDVSEDHIASIIRVERISELVTTNFFPSSLILLSLTMEPISSSVATVLTGVTRRLFPRDGSLHRIEYLSAVSCSGECSLT